MAFALPQPDRLIASAARFLRRLRGAGGDRPWATAAEWVSRAGYVARGFVYLSIGAVALLAALDLAPRAEGATGALQAWSRWPLGWVLLWGAGLGLYGFAGWRVLQSVFDADHRGRTARALAERAGLALSAVVHAGLAISTFGLLDFFEDLNEADDRQSARAGLEQVLTMPGGGALVAVGGLFLAGVGVSNLIKAWRHDFTRRLACGRAHAGWVARLGRAGYAARGLVFVLAGLAVTSAGLSAHAGPEAGVGGALQRLESLPAGSLWLSAAAAGMAAFGLYAFAQARWRRIDAEAAIEA